MACARFEWEGWRNCQDTQYERETVLKCEDKKLRNQFAESNQQDGEFPKLRVRPPPLSLTSAAVCLNVNEKVSSSARHERGINISVDNDVRQRSG